MTSPGTPLRWPLDRQYHHAKLVSRDVTFTWGTRTYIMGIVNVTPDSFSGDGTAGDVTAAVAQAQAFVADGADIIDIGAESSRPGSAPLDAEEELARLLPTLRAVRAAVAAPISVDTYHATVAAAAVGAGADAINDIHGLRFDPAMADVIARSGAALIAMHNQRGRETHDVAGDIHAGFAESLRIATAAGIPQRRIVLDPGFGFGWTEEENLEMLRRLPELWAHGLPLLVGTSRKSTIGRVLDLPVEQRLEGTGATVAMSIAAGCDIVRVHDVASMRRTARMTDAIVRGAWSGA